VRAEIKGRQWSGFKLKLALLPECIDRLAGEGQGKLARPIDRTTDKALARWWRKVVRSGRRLNELSIAERHEMRKRLKTLRYAVELLAPLYPPKDVQRFAKKLRGLQDRFGYLNDVAVAEKLKLMRADGMAGDPDLQRAVGYVIGWHTARAEEAWSDTRSAWKQMKKTSPFWV
jgi:CHAD domain-containing protein